MFQAVCVENFTHVGNVEIEILKYPTKSIFTFVPTHVQEIHSFLQVQ